jgi:hypothetical protein
LLRIAHVFKHGVTFHALKHAWGERELGGIGGHINARDGN